MSTSVIDSDQHLVEMPSLWRDHADPTARDDALHIQRDTLGYDWLTWRDQPFAIADLRRPGDVDAIGQLRDRYRRGLPAAEREEVDVAPRDYWDPAARVAKLDELDLDEAVVFPNFGLVWERTLDESLPALTTNMTAWNRWCETVAHDGLGRLHPVAHLTLRDEPWLLDQLASLGRAGIRLAMIAPALVDGHPLSHPDHDRIWAAFVEHGVTPVFHTADQRRPFGDTWYTDADGDVDPVLQSVFIWAPAALACTDLILNGVLARHPELRLGCFEASGVWVPMHLMLLDGGHDIAARLNGRPTVELAERPSDYFRRQIRVSAFAYERPAQLARQSAAVYMACSDYPHSVGTAGVQAAYAAGDPSGIDDEAARALFHDNIAFLLRR